MQGRHALPPGLSPPLQGAQGTSRPCVQAQPVTGQRPSRDVGPKSLRPVPSFINRAIHQRPLVAPYRDPADLELAGSTPVHKRRKHCQGCGDLG